MQPGNLVVSPFSVETVLAMVYAGAREETAKQMAKALHFPTDPRVLHTSYGGLLRDLKERNTSGFKIAFANRLFAQKGYPFLEPFQELLRDKYQADLDQMELTGWPNGFDSGKAESARKQINRWVSEQTKNKITTILPPSLPDANTRLILINAVWLKGKWATPFTKALTTDSPFHLGGRKSVPVPMMRLTAEFRYVENTQFQVLEMPYVSRQVAMIVFLPQSGSELDKLERSLSHEQTDQLLRKLKKRNVQVYLPRFTIQFSFDLKSILQEMGMRNAFETHADFSGITPSSPFFIQAAIHSAWVEVDEEGTEAAAATAFTPITTGTADKPVIFNADHPYLFLIRDTQTGLILFLGRVTAPLRG